MACGDVRTLLILLLAVAYSRPEFGQPLVSNGRDTQPNEVPWNVGIYNLVNGSYDHHCGGTLISEKVVVTAAHCFWNPQFTRLQRGSYKAGLGKYHRGFYVRETSAQLIDVEHFYVHRRFRGPKRNFDFDIAVVLLKNTARVTNAVQLATVDWSRQYDARQMVNGNNGTVAGWGITESGNRSDVLKTVALPFLDSDACYDMLADEYQKFATVDKFCAGYTDKSISVCPGDSGGGLMFHDIATDTWYLRGVVSIAFKPAGFQGRCYDQQVTGFTQVSHPGILDWIRGYVDKLTDTMRCAVPPTLVAVVACILLGAPRGESLQCYSCRSAKIGSGLCDPNRRQVVTCIKPHNTADQGSTNQGNKTRQADNKKREQEEAKKIKESIEEDAKAVIRNITYGKKGSSRSFSQMRNVKMNASEVGRHGLIEGHRGQVEGMDDDEPGRIRETELVDWEKEQRDEEDRVEKKVGRNETSKESPTDLELHQLSKRSPKKDESLLGGLPVDDKWCGSFMSAKDGYRLGCGVHVEDVVFATGCHKMADDYENVAYCRCDGDLCEQDVAHGVGRRGGSQAVTWVAAVVWWGVLAA